MLLNNIYMQKILLFFLCSLFFVGGFSQKKDSLTTQDYMKMGFPNPERDWTAQDYTKAFNLLSEIATKDIYLLPLKKGKNSGEMFNKFAQVANSPFLDEKKHDLQTRFSFATNVAPYIGQVVMMYLKADPSKGEKLYFSNEVAAVMGSMLMLLEKQLVFVQQFLEINKDLNETQLEGLKKFKNGANTSISGMLQTLRDEYTYYEKEDILSLGERFFATYKNIYPFLNENAQIEYNLAFQKLAEKHEYEEIRKMAKEVNMAEKP